MTSELAPTPTTAAAAKPKRSNSGHLHIDTLQAVDVEILRFLIRFQVARGHHIASWTGAPASTVSVHLGKLARRGLIRSIPINVDLRDAAGKIRSHLIHVWVPTSKAALKLDPWIVPGTGGMAAWMPVRAHSPMLVHHLLGVVDLAVWYRQQGFQVAAEKDIKNLELGSVAHGIFASPKRKFNPSQQYWSVVAPLEKGLHPPDLGAVAPDGTRWAVELERALKKQSTYVSVLKAYRDAHRGQIWHVLGQPTAKRLIAACGDLDIELEPCPNDAGVFASADGLIRLQGWVPGRAGFGSPRTWKSVGYPTVAPAGLPTLDVLPDLGAPWRKGALVNVHGPDSGSGRVI